MAAFEIKKDPNKVYILGTGSGWQLAPKNTEKTVYCLNDYIYYEKYQIKPDVLFVMDVLDEKPQIVSGVSNLGEVIKRINAFKCPMISPFRYEEIPLSQSFPLEKCIEKFGIPYFTNTICYMIAYALLQDVKEIHLFGVNQAGSHEYTEERGGVEYWLGIANGLNVKVVINGKNSQLLRFKGRYGDNILYGYLQSLNQIQELKDKFGEAVIRKLTPFQRERVNKTRKVR